MKLLFVLDVAPVRDQSETLEQASSRMLAEIRDSPTCSPLAPLFSVQALRSPTLKRRRFSRQRLLHSHPTPPSFKTTREDELQLPGVALTSSANSQLRTTPLVSPPSMA